MAFAPSALAAPPQVIATSFSGITETAATLEAFVDPTGGTTKALFDYTTLAEYKAQGFGGASHVPAEGILVPSSVKGKGTLTKSSEFITGVETTAGTFAVGQSISAGSSIPAEAKIVAIEVEAGGETLKLEISKSPTETISPASLTATGPQPISAPLGGLTAGSGYVFRVVAKKVAGAQEEAQGPATTFYTFSAPPTFSSCPNDALRSGTLAPSGAPGALLPDCRSFELASPLDKNGNEALSSTGLARAAVDGSAVTFGSTFGLPGGQGAQSLPFYQATRSTEGWSTTGLLPPGAAGDEAKFLVGQLPDLSSTYATARHFASPSTSALFEIHRDGSPATQITPYAAPAPGGGHVIAFAGASAGASSVLIESELSFPTVEGSPVPAAPNVYAWDRQSGHLHLASVMNIPARTEAKLARGAYAGPYDWAGDSLASGGPAAHYYVTDQHAVSKDGSVFFTSRSTGHLYERVNPTKPQSAVLHAGEADEECSEAAKACTIDISATERHPPDSAGEQPAAFQGATPDGLTAFFTSSEELTADANTGPPQPPARIGRGTLHGDGAADEINESFIPAHALGMVVDPEGEFVYWADPSKGTIGRAKLDGSGNLVPGSTEPDFIAPGEGECPELVKDAEEPEAGVHLPPVFEDMPIPSKPRFVAVDEGHVYWTNTGREDNEGPIDGGGTIGRATLTPDGSGTEAVAPDFICGAAPDKLHPDQRAERLVSNPQGIAVNSEHIYWANAARGQGDRTIARAVIGGGEVEERFAKPFGEFTPYGLAMDATRLYFDVNDENNNVRYLERVSLSGEEEVVTGGSKAGLRGLAVDSGHVYWATQGEGGVIGRADLELSAPSIDNEFIDVEGTPTGLAASGGHLLWSVNAESPKSPGTDLYRYQRGAPEPLTDLTPDSADPNGAEVQGVLGTSADGSYVYFAANADLGSGGPAEPGDCTGRLRSSVHGECSIYLYHDGQIRFVARVSAEGGDVDSGAANWLPLDGSADGYRKLSSVSADGKSLVFRSDGNLYRFRLGKEIACLSCSPTGGTGAGFASTRLGFPFTLGPSDAEVGAVPQRFASDEGNRVFFQSTEALVASDTDGVSGCPRVGSEVTFYPSCLDIYEWEEPGSGSCTEGGPGYSPANQGCIYMISQGEDSGPAFLIDSSSSGDDVFFFTRSGLVGEDTDGLRDVYDARVDGGLASQNPLAAPPCEGESCKPAATAPPAYQAPPQFTGPSNPKPKRCHGKRCHRHKKKHHRKKHHPHQTRPGGRR